MMHVETDAENGTNVHLLHGDPRPTDDLYGEQPYCSPQGDRIALHHHPAGDAQGGLSVVDLEEGALYPVLDHDPPTLPAFHAWGPHLYYQEPGRNAPTLMRCSFRSLETTRVLELPDVGGTYSYGTVSPDGRFYAASVHPSEDSSLIVLVEISSGEHRVLARTDEQWFKHEQFSRDGRNKILIQANSSDVSVVNLGEVDVQTGEIDWLPVDAPPPAGNGNWPGGDRHTPRCTGHEAWIGRTNRVFLSTGYDETRGTNIWTAAADDASPRPACTTPHKLGHVSVSRCGSFWIADAPAEEGVPIYMGAFGSDVCRRLVFSRTRHDGNQWSHTHPYLVADNRWLIFNSTRSGHPQVYAARIREEFLAQLR